MFRQIGITGETVDILATGIYGMSKVLAALNVHMLTFCKGVVKVVFVFVFFFMVDHPFFGRRNSLLTGSILMLVAFYTLGGLVKYIEIDQAALPPGVEPPVGPKGYVAMVMLFIFAVG